MTKTKLILEHMRNERGITSLEAFQMFGTTRLASIIHNLRTQGYEIETIERDEKDRYGNRVRFAEYRLKKGA